MPKTIVTDLEIDYCRGELIATTHDRAVWESNIINLDPSKITLLGITLTINSNTTWSAAVHGCFSIQFKIVEIIHLTQK
jgi:hypothetical protein